MLAAYLWLFLRLASLRITLVGLKVSTMLEGIIIVVFSLCIGMIAKMVGFHLCTIHNGTNSIMPGPNSQFRILPFFRPPQRHFLAVLTKPGIRVKLYTRTQTSRERGDFMEGKYMLAAFLENAGLLSERFGITPLLYGSLGLEYLTGETLNADDIDILIPKVFLGDQWDVFRGFLEEKGYRLIDLHEHTFEKDGIHFSYAQMEELEAFAGIPMEEIGTAELGSVLFRLLSLGQYLQVYTASSRDGYRVNTKNKKDSEKIALIRELLREET